MCRIYGYFGRENGPRRSHRRALTQLMAGGPDEQTYAMGSLPRSGTAWSWLLGSNRLAITDLMGGDQPYREDNGELTAVFNGEIYNHLSLRAKLGAKFKFIDYCDGRVILPLYTEYGLDYPRHLDGMYAIAIFDRRKQRLVLVTDPVGIKPIYYHWNDATETLYFASEIPALLELSGCPRELAPETVDAYFTARAVYGERTILKNVFRLRPGAIMVLEPGLKPAIQNCEATVDRELLPSGDFEVDAAILRDLLDDEVRSLLMADVPVATILSGGLDSSLITAIAARHNRDLHSFHIRYDKSEGQWPADESAYARELAALTQINHHEVVVNPADFPEWIGDVAWCVGANADPITLSSKVLFRAVKRAGFRSILSGDGADELFGGYDRMVDALRDHSADWAASYVDALSALSRPLRDELYTDDYRDFLLRTELTSELLEERLHKLVEKHDGDRLAGILEFEQTDRLPAYHLARVDATSMAHGVEVRVPFLQGRIVRFSRRLASAHKIDSTGVKRLLYRAAEGLITEAIQRRPKQPFTLPVYAMLAEGEPLYEYARDVLSPSVLRSGGYLKPSAVESLVERHGRCQTNETGLAVWSLLMFQAFVTEHVDDLQCTTEALHGFDGIANLDAASL